jgi:hypothetical protein
VVWAGRSPGAGELSLRVGACLSLSGSYARFGSQAARGLEVWSDLDGASETRLEDDASDPARVPASLRSLAAECDLLLGPYSTQLMRVAAAVALERGLLLWNHGGAGDDVQSAAPSRVVSVLTPASRYAEPFLNVLASLEPKAPLWIVRGSGGFARQVARGAAAAARRLGLETVTAAPRAGGVFEGVPPLWDLLCAARFEEDVVWVEAARRLPSPPRLLCSVAAGVRAFGAAVAEPAGVFGVAQWFPGTGPTAELGPDEARFISAYSAGGSGLPDYPAVQAAAAAVLATHCARLARSTDPAALWRVAAGLDTSTLFGRFQVDPATGVQIRHETRLVRWSRSGVYADGS